MGCSKGWGLLSGTEVVSAGEGGKKGCGLLRGAGKCVNWCGSQEAVCTVEGDRKWCRLVREARRGVHC